jgi:hypothetical protein
MNKNLKENIKVMTKEKIRQILTSNSSSKEDKKIAEDELIKRNSQMRGDDNRNGPIIDSKKLWIYIIVAIVILKLIKYLVSQ